MLGAPVGMLGEDSGVTTDGVPVKTGMTLGGEADGIVTGKGGVLGARIGIDMDMDMDMDTLKRERRRVHAAES